MGGRGASSGNNSKLTKKEREAYEKYVQQRLNSKEYMRQNNPGLFSIKYPKEATEDFYKSIRKRSE